MKKLYCGVEVPTTININERIFKVETFENETILCNLTDAKKLLYSGNIKNLWHLWDFNFKRFGKLDLKKM